MRRDLAYTVLDVFAERALEGNPLAVFHDGRGLSGEQMQAIAREMSLSETTFVLPADDPLQDRDEGVRVRIFTTQEELPFAGHPTLGTASWLHLNHPPTRGAETVTLRLNVGPIPVRFETPAQGVQGGAVYGSMRQRDPEFGEEHNRGEVAAVIGVPESDLLLDYKPQTVSTGNPFCIVALRSLQVLERLSIPQREASAWLRDRGARWFYCIAPDPASEVWHARMQWIAGEDPATGSAAGPCIAWLVRTGLVKSSVPVLLRQGVQIQRPSQLTVQATRIGETITDVFVAGRTIPVASGRLFLQG